MQTSHGLETNEFYVIGEFSMKIAKTPLKGLGKEGEEASIWG